MQKALPVETIGERSRVLRRGKVLTNDSLLRGSSF